MCVYCICTHYHLCSPFCVACHIMHAMAGYWENTCHVQLTKLLSLCINVVLHSLWNTDVVNWILSCLLRLPDSRCKCLASVANQKAWVVSKSIQTKTKLSRSTNLFSGGIQPDNLGPTKKTKDVKCIPHPISSFKRTRHVPNSGRWIILLSSTGLDADLWVLLNAYLLSSSVAVWQLRDMEMR